MSHCRSRAWAPLLPFVGVAVFAALLMIPAFRAADGFGSPQLAADGPAMPEFTRRSAEAWLNTQPLTAAEVRGKVILLEVYTSG